MTSETSSILTMSKNHYEPLFSHAFFAIFHYPPMFFSAHFSLFFHYSSVWTCGGLLKWGYPHSWMVSQGNFIKMGWKLGVPPFMEPPQMYFFTLLPWFSSVLTCIFHHSARFHEYSHVRTHLFPWVFCTFSPSFGTARCSPRWWTSPAPSAPCRDWRRALQLLEALGDVEGGAGCGRSSTRWWAPLVVAFFLGSLRKNRRKKP